MEQDTPTLVSAIAALIVAVALMIRQHRNGGTSTGVVVNGNGNGNGTEAKINVEVERRVKYHDLSNEMQKIALSVEAQGVDLRKALEKFETFRESVTTDLASIKTTLKYYPFRPTRVNSGDGDNG